MRLIILPQALRVIIPPLISQYLNLTKNSSLAIAIGFPDLVSVWMNTSLNQSGRAIPIVAMTMAFYCIVSLTVSLIMNVYNRRVAEGALRPMSDVTTDDAKALVFQPSPPGPRRRAPSAWIGWMRATCSRRPNTLLTIVGAYIVYTFFSVLNWAVFNAVWEAENRRECLDLVGRSGACWPGAGARALHPISERCLRRLHRADPRRAADHAAVHGSFMLPLFMPTG
jgi:hypothetical protein